MRFTPASLLLAVVVALATLMVAPGPGHADDGTKAARKHYQQGEKLFALGRFDEALVAYEAAFEAKPLPGFLFNIGQCHRNLGDLESAIFSFRKYLKLDPDADNRDAVESLIEELQQELDAQQEQPLVGPPPPRRHDDRRARAPFYKRWWFWSGVAVAAGAGAGTYLLLRDTGIPDTDLGNVVFR
ncbi:MAG: tetratricopeptide repeat protein [Kofleriaceae bacterium]|nr:tetratricopeptide repeat protein [Kofleriaceae bacterium]MCB9574235.1 tetratricopeptide repeat protein [Kofleriaceae bacterium]